MKSNSLTNRTPDEPTRDQQREELTVTPRVDIRETSDCIYLEAEMPGVGKDDVDVKVEDSELLILGRSSESGPAGHEAAHCEYRYGNYERSFRLSEAIDTEKISAEMKHGVLQVCLPKRESAKPRSIPVKVA